MSIESGSYYIDSSVLIHQLWRTGTGKDTRSAKKFLKEIERGHGKGIVSMWTLMEIITVIRNLWIKNDETREGIIEQEIALVLEKVFSIKNLEMIEGNPQELSQLGLKAPMLCEVLSNALEILKDTGYEIIELSSGRFKLRGIGGNDALHISIAKSFGCDYVASLDRGFWTEKRDLPIYDVSEGVMK